MTQSDESRDADAVHSARSQAQAQAAIPPMPPMKAELAAERVELAAALASGIDGRELGELHARSLDRVIAHAFANARDAIAHADRKRSHEPVDMAVAAVGSYGRGAVALRSDADFRLVTRGSGAARERAESIAEAMLYPLWDAGLSVGHQVMDEGEAIALAHQDLATATTLLDLRAVPGAGDRARVQALLDRAWIGVFAEASLSTFFEKLEEERTARHARFGGSVYLLEPDVKSGAGGQRDLDAARWIVRSRFKVGNDAKNVWQELVQLGILVTREAHEIEAAEAFLWRVRNRLHAHAGRRSDRLTFEEQEAIAIEMGYGDRDRNLTPGSTLAEANAPPTDTEVARAAERFMQDYYLKARAVTRARERLLHRATPPKRRGRPLEADLGKGVKLFDGQISVAASDLAVDPALALRMYIYALRRNAPILPYARDAVAQAASDPQWAVRLRESPEAAATFVELIGSVPDAPTKRGSMAGELHDVGLLLAMIPEFQPVTGRVHHDIYHVYTVDVHSVAAVDALRTLSRGELAAEYPLATRLAAEVARARPLFLATLLHDVGKGYPDASGSRKNHSQSGAEICDHLLPRLGLEPDEVKAARDLVAWHLAMYHTATRRDLDDPTTVEEFAKLVGNREALRDLYLLTIVDITTTSPTAMTSWKARMLDELYFATDAYLTEHAVRHPSQPTKMRSDLDDEPESVRHFAQSMPERYALANPAAAIRAHAAVAADRAKSGKVVHAALVPSRHSEAAELCVVAEDRPGLLAGIAAAITAGRLEVLAAQVHSRDASGDGNEKRSEAVDLFWVRDRIDGVAGVERALPRLLRDLEAVCGAVGTEPLDPAELAPRESKTARWRERPSPAIAPEIVIDDRASDRHTVVEIFAKDRPGLLYTIARAFHALGLSIATSKINTEGARVADVFYVSELDGTKLKLGERSRAVRDALLAALITD